ncbi:M15 family metallopeptidase [Neptuniibacter halophilus]|uniref:M15 family metallopeptidase n=1 Tax=Neptuniibacter halophilus TaxID=651666 RepID=UPI0025733A2B|nr:M15 family metallopeptidase [Neptuniibacter halophilus]
MKRDSGCPGHQPELFVDLQQLEPGILIDLKYYTGDNFVGSRINGYEAERCLLTKPAALALQRVQHELKGFGLGLKVFDAYRPQRAVDHFIAWCAETGDTPTRKRFFPALERPDLFARGYLIRHSSHTRGSTVDLTLVDLANAEELAMGTEFDFFGEASWFDSQAVSPQARANRMLLQSVMQLHGFVPFQQEWWHFTLQDEPCPDQYFDFVIA